MIVFFDNVNETLATIIISINSLINRCYFKYDEFFITYNVN